MKWCFTTNETSLNNDDFFRQLQVAVLSARSNTSLDPHLVYDGTEHERLQWMREHGVKVLPHRLSFGNALSKYVNDTCDLDAIPNLVDIRKGAHLKMEVPSALKGHGVRDRVVLYTDCDVIFMRDVELGRNVPRYVAACGSREGGRTRFRLGGWMHFNSGVLLMNVDAMYEEAAAYRSFVLSNGCGVRRLPSEFMQKNLFLSDQVAINLFYRRRLAKLDFKYNWHPSRGVDKQVRIVHFNGLKWTQWDSFCNGQLSFECMAKFRRLVDRNRAAFKHYVEVAQSYQALTALEVS